MKCLLFSIVLTSAIYIQKSSEVPTSIRRVIVDVDVGADDAFALNILIHAEQKGQIKIEAIVCSTGNSDITNVCENLIRVLEILKRTDIPVYKGAPRSIVPLRQDLPRRYFFGRDGFGNLDDDWKPDLSIIKDTPAYVAIHELVVNNPGEITLICLSPLTTIALTMVIYEDFVPNLKQIWVMGGNYKVKGNLTDAGEFNFVIDPESTNVVLHNGGCPIILLTWETCMDVGITMDWRFNVLGKQATPFMELLNKVEGAVFKNDSLYSTWEVCDAFTVCSMVHPEIILEKSIQKASIELCNSTTRGRLELDDKTSDRRNVILIEKIDSEAVKNILLQSNECLSCY